MHHRREKNKKTPEKKVKIVYGAKQWFKKIK
jgi:hypothetical protein